ncbi:MAG: nuclear transport factor 2 family protein [Verrucomicrobiota bacterium]|jgi:hypothetical protein|nr:nuclear transport factor 2 family protein [Verrucomicrobiota bacterium]MDP7048052.1 nuclear transport factor 2 family protein [Verrucomicrobiota bacterium]
MKHILTTIAAIVLVGCASTQHMAKQDVKRVLHEFFHNLDFKRYERDTFRAMVTDDFHIYEAGKHMSRSEFFDFIESTHSDASISNDWLLSDFRIATDRHSAHISYKNVGTFVSKTAEGKEAVLNIHWLENAYFVKEGGRLKIQFLHSEELKRETGEN